jgi:acetylornithine deacetylase
MNNEKTGMLADAAIALLKRLIYIPSFSKEEGGTASVIEAFLQEQGVAGQRFLNNIWAVNRYFDASKPIILLNSHHDTVKPNPGYTLDPFEPAEKEGKLFGLGSNDAGGPLVALLAAFLYFYDTPDLAYNLVIAATAEEEISGKNGVEALLQDETFLTTLGGGQKLSLTAGKIAAIVGEPTLMRLAVAERGLMVLDCTAQGRAGHAARSEGDNAIIKAIKDIEWFHAFSFDKISHLLGPVKMNVTVINTENKAHNVVPAACSFVVDVRVNEYYTFDEVTDVIRAHVASEVAPRSTRLRSSAIALDHPLVRAGLALGRTYYGSPTTSDKALMPFPALKMGPGDSARSHTADEFIYLDEIREGIELYVQLLEKIM